MMQLFAHPEQEAISVVCLRFLSSAILLKANKTYLKHHFLKYPQMVQSYIEVVRSKGVEGRRESTFFDSLI
jgi:hypothetical protein